MATRIDLNHAAPEELTAIAGIDSKRAGAIVSYRSEHGRFESWEDVEHVPGVGGTLLEKLRDEATLGDVGAEDEGDEEQEDEAAELEDVDPDEVAALIAIANLDEEAATAYELVARSVEDRELAEMLRSFGADHRRHVKSLGRILAAIGRAPASNPQPGILVGLASTMGVLDPIAAVNALIANEHLTNGTYENALIFVTLGDAQDVLAANAADERRHIEALIAYHEKHLDEDVEEEADDAI